MYASTGCFDRCSTFGGDAFAASIQFHSIDGLTKDFHIWEIPFSQNVVRWGKNDYLRPFQNAIAIPFRQSWFADETDYLDCTMTSLNSLWLSSVKSAHGAAVCETMRVGSVFDWWIRWIQRQHWSIPSSKIFWTENGEQHISLLFYRLVIWALSTRNRTTSQFQLAHIQYMLHWATEIIVLKQGNPNELFVLHSNKVHFTTERVSSAGRSNVRRSTRSSMTFKKP